jgi:hypothetical protein
MVTQRRGIHDPNYKKEEHMNYQSIVRMFLDTPASQWKRVSGSHEYAFCMEDVNLRIVSTLNEEDIQADDFAEPWANGFTDPRARGYFYNFYYGETLLHRFILVSVDGGRASLPIPQIGTMEVSQADWKAAEIFDQLNTLARYAREAGLTVGPAVGL